VRWRQCHVAVVAIAALIGSRFIEMERLICLARNQIDEELKKYYRACTTGELPPQLLALSKKLDEELLKKQERSAVA
jgi:hypothetical protein